MSTSGSKKKIMSQKHSHHGFVVMELKNSWQWTYGHEIAGVVGGKQHNSGVTVTYYFSFVIKQLLSRLSSTGLSLDLGPYQDCPPPHDWGHVWVSVNKKTFDNQIAFDDQLLNGYPWTDSSIAGIHEIATTTSRAPPWCHLERK